MNTYAPVYIALIGTIILTAAPELVMAQGPGMGHGWGMRGGQCPMCGRDWDDRGRQVTIPDKLPAPGNEMWINELKGVLAMEKLSKVQYEADSRRHRIAMPYHMIIFQEGNHIDWIERLFTSYGIKAAVKTPPVSETKDIEAAFELGMKLEKELVPRYEWLVKNARDKDSADIIDFILLQTRMHYTMFSHASQMGWMRQGMGGQRGGMRGNQQ